MTTEQALALLSSLAPSDLAREFIALQGDHVQYHTPRTLCEGMADYLEQTTGDEL